MNCYKYCVLLSDDMDRDYEKQVWSFLIIKKKQKS